MKVKTRMRLLSVSLLLFAALFCVFSAPSARAEAAQAAAEATEDLSPERIAERYWEVFSDCFEGMDFNPVSFRFHDDGWDSITQMSLVCRLEEAFGISFKGRETMKITSYRAGLELVRKKLKEAEGGK